MTRKLISCEEAVKGKAQHTKPCSDCPMSRNSLPGWLGGATPEEYGHLAHSDKPVACHAIKGQQCAGMAIYRKNACQMAEFRLPADHQAVFSHRLQFLEHHRRGLGAAPATRETNANR